MAALLRRHRDLLTASLMGFTAGYTTSNTKVRFDTFGGMMTVSELDPDHLLRSYERLFACVARALLACVALPTG